MLIIFMLKTWKHKLSLFIDHFSGFTVYLLCEEYMLKLLVFVHLTLSIRYWWAKIRGLADVPDFEELDRFSRSKKSPIGYEVSQCDSYILHHCHLHLVTAIC